MQEIASLVCFREDSNLGTALEKNDSDVDYGNVSLARLSSRTSFWNVLESCSRQVRFCGGVPQWRKDCFEFC
jgi:hypothetical protein